MDRPTIVIKKGSINNSFYYTIKVPVRSKELTHITLCMPNAQYETLLRENVDIMSLFKDILK